MRMSPNRDEDKAPLWAAGFILGAGLLMLFGFVGRFDFEAHEAMYKESLRRNAAALALASGFERCPPHEPGTTGIVTMTIRAVSDDQPEVISCARMAMRKYQVAK